MSRNRPRLRTPRDIWKADGPIYRHRLSSNMSQAELGEAIGEAQSRIADWEALRARCWPKIVERMASVFGCDATELYAEYVQWAAMEPDISQREKQAAARKSMRHTSPIARAARARGFKSVHALAKQAGVPGPTLTAYAYDPNIKGIHLPYISDVAETMNIDRTEFLGKLCEWQCRFRGLSPEDCIAEVVLYEEDLAERGELFYDDIDAETEEEWEQG